VRGSVQFIPYLFQNRVSFTQYFMIPKPKPSEPPTIQSFGPVNISVNLLRMLAAVKFND
jgi:hypothetical protein